ncbi:hypothetical protein BKA58DRAFT_463010 [Alternaria rosae]|uniref:uncharacterized protein n=1 Tax=Alternaria rosae TaxID=1187941 RepID=UPI001E8EA6B2|nr:uncharacterized protein BKA58DRAFT_463010 [Alternaria rosae]KAH6865283.1 hypothetical protein BKA58DRAFT_463010 [Alternaria rosae]
MPPKKDQLSPLDLRQKADDHGIRFHGPVPPTSWKKGYRHNFKVIRALQFLRYEEYLQNERIPTDRKENYKKGVKELRTQVQDLLDEANANEASWRDLESPIFDRFRTPVICQIMRRFLSTKSVGASLMLNETLEGPAPAIVDGLENRQKTIKEELISHVSGDNLDSTNISMRPDAVIGLRSPSSIARNETHYPAKNRPNLFLPFLVIEAKKEKDAPGFRSIQYQTAFPVRRFLMAQSDIDSRDDTSEPCLVWFFAYQGEQWRLHAGTLDEDKVRIFDLWQGTIQSQDGALQLLLIVDFIWSWARDVYRTAIRELIANSRTSFDSVSPVSTDRFRHSISLCPTSSPAPNSQDLEGIQVDGTVNGYDRSQRQQSTEEVALQDARSEPFLRWAVGHPNSPSWTAFGSIRHANIVQFEFQYHNYCAAAGSWEERRLSNKDRLFKTVSKEHSIRISRELLDDVAYIWGTRIQPDWGLGLACALRATFYFHTYCDKSSWQIKRVLHCMIWEAEQLPVHKNCNTKDLMTAMLLVRSFHGRDSASHALRSTGLILRPNQGEEGPEWVPFLHIHLSENTRDILSGLAAGSSQDVERVRHISLDNGLLQIATGSEEQHQRVPASWGRDTRTGDSLIAIRSSSWPDTSPRYCMFVLCKTGYESGSELLNLLEKAAFTKNTYADPNCQWGEDDKRTIRAGLCQWREALVRETTNTA